MTAHHPAADQLVARVCSEVRTVELRLTGAPDVPNRYDNGTIAPTRVSITCRSEDGRRTVTAHLYGKWRSPDGDLTDEPCAQSYPGHRTDEAWPAWLAQLARDHEPQEWEAAHPEFARH